MDVDVKQIGMAAPLERDDEKCSIVVPVYNRQKTISETITSCLNQSYPNIEIILVDDGSSDRSASICSEFANRPSLGKSIIFVRQKNSGACVARNRGMALATGKYLLFLDSDDTIPFDKLSKQISAMVETGADCSISDFITVDDNGEQIDVFRNDVSPKDFISKLKSPSNSAIVMRRSTMPATLEWNTRLDRMQDVDFMLRYLASVKSWIYVPEPLYLYRVHSGPRISDSYLQGMPYGSLFLSMCKHLLHNRPGTTTRISLLASYGIALTRSYLNDMGSRALPSAVKIKLKRIRSKMIS